MLVFELDAGLLPRLLDQATWPRSRSCVATVFATTITLAAVLAATMRTLIG